MTKKEITEILVCGNSCIIPVGGRALGVTTFQAFLSIRPVLKGRLYWNALRRAYEHSDDLYHYRYDIKEVFKRDEPDRDSMMNKKERDYLQKLPDKITIYRGMTKKEYQSKEFGISWSLKKEKAEYFAFKYGRNFSTYRLKKTVHQVTINKKDVIAFLNGREEYEIIYLGK
ncbi:MAG: hypothetical protein WKF85_03490 [Chitinophagaceae bacterium]